MKRLIDMRPPLQKRKDALNNFDFFPSEKITAARKLPSFDCSSLNINKGKKEFKKTIITVIIVFLLVLLSSGSIYWWQKNKAERNRESKISDKQKVQTFDENVWDLPKTEKEISQNSNFVMQKLVFLERENDHVIFFLKNPVDGNKEIIFEFDQKSVGNGIEKKYINASLSPDKKTMAYITDNGLSVYNIEKKENNPIVKKEKEALINLGISPQWSISGLENVYALASPSWSPDGQFLSFIQIYADQYSLGVINVKSKEYYPVQGVNGEKIYGLNARWSPVSNIIVTPEFEGESQSGLFVSLPEKSNTLYNLSEKLGKKEVDFYESAISNDGSRIAFIYKEDYEEEYNNTLAVSNIDGSNFIILDQKDSKTVPFFSADDKSILFLNELSDDNLLLSSVSLENKKKKDLVIFPKNFNYWYDPFWLEGKYLSIIGKAYDPLNENRKAKGLLLIIDIDNKKIINEMQFNENTDLLGIL